MQNLHTYCGNEIHDNSCLASAQALFDKVLYAVTAGRKSNKEYIRLNKFSTSSHWNDSEQR